MAKENKDTGHKDLQSGQFGVIGEEVVWDRADVVLV